MRSLTLSATALALLAAAPAARAADLFTAEPAALLRTESLTAEAFAGYLTGTAREYVYNVPGDGKKLSQLDWRMNGFALGGRVAYRPTDWLTARIRGWSTVAGSSDMTDYDWMGGYYGMNSWTHRSISSTDTAKAWQIDGSLAASLYESDDLSFSAIAGYRYMTSKWNATGGSYVYSVNDFRDTAGLLPADRLGIAYQQWWSTPYLGVGASTTLGDWSFSGEIIGSPFVMSRDKDHHALRALVFTEKFALSSMIGTSASVEYRLSPVMSLTGRVEYQNYLGATGSTRIADGNTGAVSHYPRPSGGADAETLLVSLGVKARM
jgi:plasminogen activator